MHCRNEQIEKKNVFENWMFENWYFEHDLRIFSFDNRKKTVHRFSKCHYSNSSLWPCHADLASHTPPCGHACHDTKSNIFFNEKTQKTSIQYSNLISFTQHLLPINNQREKKKFKSNTTHLSAFVQLEWNPPTAKSTYPSSVCFPVISPTREQKRKRKKYIWTNHNHW